MRRVLASGCVLVAVGCAGPPGTATDDAPDREADAVPADARWPLDAPWDAPHDAGDAVFDEAVRQTVREQAQRKGIEIPK